MSGRLDYPAKVGALSLMAWVVRHVARTSRDICWQTSVQIVAFVLLMTKSHAWDWTWDGSVVRCG
jgi:hypothetical protein